MNKAVITADIIHSTRMVAENKQWLYNAIANALQVISDDFKIESEMYRGDSFQCLIHKPADALRIGLIIKTYIRSLNPSELTEVSSKNPLEDSKNFITPIWMFDVRMAIGIGKVDVKMKSVVTSDGEAFYLSGTMLDEMKNSRNRLGITTADKHKDELLIESMLLDAIITKASALQCEVINLKLLGYTEMEIAQKLEVNQSAVNQRSVSGNWNVINKMVQHFEKLYSNG
jgi:hypothetical protein